MVARQSLSRQDFFLAVFAAVDKNKILPFTQGDTMSSKMDKLVRLLLISLF